MLPWVLCIHVIRKGEDVVASSVDRARKYPERFSSQSDPEYGIRQWNRSIRATERAIMDPGHAIVAYGSLVADVEATMRALSEVAGMEFEPSMLSPARQKSFVEPHEEWKSSLDAPVVPAESKFHTLFEGPAQARISSRLDHAAFERLKQKAAQAPGGVFLS
jgi:hypothetical protein